MFVKMDCTESAGSLFRVIQRAETLDYILTSASITYCDDRQVSLSPIEVIPTGPAIILEPELHSSDSTVRVPQLCMSESNLKDMYSAVSEGIREVLSTVSKFAIAQAEISFCEKQYLFEPYMVIRETTTGGTVNEPKDLTYALDLAKKIVVPRTRDLIANLPLFDIFAEENWIVQ